MLLVVDMNVLFSFFKKFSPTRKLISTGNLQLFSPRYALDELNEHLKELLPKSRINIGAFELLKTVLSWYVNFIPVSEYKEFKAEAESTSPDPNDTQYFALALKLRCAIWSNDKLLKKQDRVEVFSTSQLIKDLGL